MELIIGINEIILLVLNLCAVQRKFWYAVRNNTRLHQSFNPDWMIRLLILHSSVIKSPVCVWSWQALWMTISPSNYFILRVFYIQTRHQQNIYFSTIFDASLLFFSVCNVFRIQRLLFGSWQLHHLLWIVWSCTGIFESNKYLKLLADDSRNTDR